ncbi:type I-G CRISPR-associated protein Csb2 [Lacunimicrobium album]
MKQSLCITIRLLDQTFHGRGERGEPEWPPSPLRLFQSLVNAAASISSERDLRSDSRLAELLRCLESAEPPVIIAPAIVPGNPRRHYVPDNVGDVIANSWSRGNIDADIASFRAEKDARTCYLVNDEAVHYLWEMTDDLLQIDADHFTELGHAVTCIGWGIDLAIAEIKIVAEADVHSLHGTRWKPIHGSTDSRSLRVPRIGTLDALLSRHQSFLARLGIDQKGERFFQPVPPLHQYRRVAYRAGIAPAPAPYAAFTLLKPDATGVKAFDTTRRATVVAGMMRHATSERYRRSEASGEVDAFTQHCILGHGEGPGESVHRPVLEGQRFCYLPLPTIEFRGKEKASVVGSIRRVLVMAKDAQLADRVLALRRDLIGVDLYEETPLPQIDQPPIAMLSHLHPGDYVLQHYLGTHKDCDPTCWATVTPVVLPGYDDNKPGKAEKLLRTSMLQAGLDPTLVKMADIELRKSGFWPGTDLASRYFVTRHLQKYPRYHVQIRFYGETGQPVAITGPLSLGGGRFTGMGLFAARPKSRESDFRKLS